MESILVKPHYYFWVVSALTKPSHWLGKWDSSSCFPRDQCITKPVAPLAETAHLQSKVPQMCLDMHRWCTRLLHCCSVSSWLQWGHVTEDTYWMECTGMCFSQVTPFFLLAVWGSPCNQGEQWNIYVRCYLENQILWIYRITSEFLAYRPLKVWRFLGSHMSREGTSELHGHLNGRVPKNGQIHEQQQGTN